MANEQQHQQLRINDKCHPLHSFQSIVLKTSLLLHRPGHPEDNFPSWSLPSIFSHQTSTSKSIGLRNFTKEQLQPYLEPILERLIHLDAEELLGLERVQTGGAILKDGIRVNPIHDRIEPAICLDQGNLVRYIHLNEVPEQYSMGIFVFPPYAKIPLHDHPGMCVLSRLLYGDIERLSLDELEENTDTDRAESPSWSHWSPKWVSSRHNDNKSNNQEKIQKKSNLLQRIPGTKLAFQNKIDHLQAPAVTSLYPFEGNLHEFVAGPNGAAVLDVLLPPYDADEDRDCTFYEIHKDNIVTNQMINTDNERNLRIIVPTGQPEDFHCISGKYLGMGSVH